MIGRAFEEFCMEFMLTQADDGKLKVEIDKFGKWWDKVGEIDLVLGSKVDNSVLLGECKLKARNINLSQLEKMQKVANKIDAVKSRKQKFIFFCAEAYEVNALSKEREDYQKVLSRMDMNEEELSRCGNVTELDVGEFDKCMNYFKEMDDLGFQVSDLFIFDQSGVTELVMAGGGFTQEGINLTYSYAEAFNASDGVRLVLNGSDFGKVAQLEPEDFQRGLAHLEEAGFYDGDTGSLTDEELEILQKILGGYGKRTWSREFVQKGGDTIASVATFLDRRFVPFGKESEYGTGKDAKFVPEYTGYHGLDLESYMAASCSGGGDANGVRSVVREECDEKDVAKYMEIANAMMNYSGCVTGMGGKYCYKPGLTTAQQRECEREPQEFCYASPSEEEYEAGAETLEALNDYNNSSLMSYTFGVGDIKETYSLVDGVMNVNALKGVAERVGVLRGMGDEFAEVFGKGARKLEGDELVEYLIKKGMDPDDAARAAREVMMGVADVVDNEVIDIVEAARKAGVDADNVDELAEFMRRQGWDDDVIDAVTEGRRGTWFDVDNVDDLDPDDFGVGITCPFDISAGTKQFSLISDIFAQDLEGYSVKSASECMLSCWCFPSQRECRVQTDKYVSDEHGKRCVYDIGNSSAEHKGSSAKVDCEALSASLACNNNGSCEESYESIENCPNDCPVEVCDSDGVCERDRGENNTNCTSDCSCNSNNVCEPARGETREGCAVDCGCDGDGTCEPQYENTSNCAADCLQKEEYSEEISGLPVVEQTPVPREQVNPRNKRYRGVQDVSAGGLVIAGGILAAAVAAPFVIGAAVNHFGKRAVRQVGAQVGTKYVRGRFAGAEVVMEILGDKTYQASGRDLVPVRMWLPGDSNPVHFMMNKSSSGGQWEPVGALTPYGNWKKLDTPGTKFEAVSSDLTASIESFIGTSKRAAAPNGEDPARSVLRYFNVDAERDFERLNTSMQGLLESSHRIPLTDGDYSDVASRVSDVLSGRASGTSGVFSVVVDKADGMLLNIPVETRTGKIITVKVSTKPGRGGQHILQNVRMNGFGYVSSYDGQLKVSSVGTVEMDGLARKLREYGVNVEFNPNYEGITGVNTRQQVNVRAIRRSPDANVQQDTIGMIRKQRCRRGRPSRVMGGGYLLKERDFDLANVVWAAEGGAGTENLVSIPRGLEVTGEAVWEVYQGGQMYFETGGDGMAMLPVVDFSLNGEYIVDAQIGSDLMSYSLSIPYGVQGGTIYLSTGDKNPSDGVLSFVPHEGRSLRIAFFDDVNNDGAFDNSDSQVVLIGIPISIEPVSRSVVYDLSSGWNLLSVPVNIPDFTASDLLSEIASQGGYATTVATYETGRWKSYKVRGDKVFSTEDFAIEPGKGYMVKVLSQTMVSLAGVPLEQSAEVDINSGWNLVGFAPGVDSEGNEVWNHMDPDASDGWDSGEVLEVLSGDGIDADMISEWKNGRYNNYIVRDGTAYGYEYGVVSVKGYFVRIKGDEKGRRWGL